MPCFRPKRAMRVVNALTGERRKTLCFGSAPPIGYVCSEVLALPCSECEYCMMQRSKDWALRMVHELQSHSRACFITLTYDDTNLPSNGSLVKRDFQLFMKRLRKEFKDVTIRFYHCGEYGSRFLRPHYHAILYGVDFDDRVFFSKKCDKTTYVSPTLQRLWPAGFSTVSDVTLESCAYVARYCMKKIHRASDCRRGVQPEYSTMSLKPAIGHEWYHKFKDDLFPKDFVTHLGRMYRVPRFYCSLYEHENPDAMSVIKQKRRELVLNNKVAFDTDSLQACEITLKSKLKKLHRELD